MPFPPPQQHKSKMMMIMLQSQPPPQPPPQFPPPKIPLPLPFPHPQKSNKRIIQIQELFPLSQLPHPQFVAAKSLIFEPPFNFVYTLYYVVLLVFVSKKIKKFL